MLYEESFAGTTPELASEVNAYANAWSTTNVNEDAFNRMRLQEAARNAARVSRLSRWYALTNTALLTDYGKEPITVTTAAKSLGPSVAPPTIFDGGAIGRFTLPAQALGAFDDSRSFARLSLAGLKLRGMAWAAVREFKADLRKLRLAWLSLLAQPGSFIHNPHLPRSQRGESTGFLGVEMGTLCPEARM